METVWVLNIVAVFLLCVIITGFLIPQVLLISFRCKLFDEADERKIHKGAVPRLGGVAFMPAIILSIAFVCGINVLFGCNTMSLGLASNNQSVIFSLCGTLVIYLTGLADDLVGVRYRAKFVSQALCAIMLICGGLWINDFHGILCVHGVPSYIGMPLTVLVVVFVTNAINLIDGIDGLASGMCGIAMIIYGVSFLFLQNYLYATIAFATLGVLIPFYGFNVFGNAEKHQKIFMGDTGTLTIGFIISMLGLRLLCVDVDVTDPCKPNRLMVVLAPLLIPCYDVVRVYIGRVRRGMNPFLPDKTHIHHKMLATGMMQRTAMVAIVSISLVLSLVLIALSICLDINILILLSALLYMGFNVILNNKISQREKLTNLK